MRIEYLLLGLLFTCLFACKPDIAVDPENQTIKDAYFDDYDSPREKWGYMDQAGETVIKPKYDDVRDMIGDITAANYKGQWGFIDKNGQTKIDFQYKQVQDFNEEGNRAFVQDFENNWLLINAQNEVIDSLDFDNFKQFTGLYCPVAKNGDWGVINQSGEIQIPTAYALIEIINDEKVIAKKYGKQGVISMDDKVLLDFQFKKITVCPSDILRMKNDKGFSFYDINNLKKVSPDYKKASLMKDGLFVAQSQSGTSIINDAFEVVKALPYDRVEYANQNRWVYKKDGLWGILDENGEVLKAPAFDLINKYEEDIILFSQDELWGYLDLNGDVFIPAELPIAWEYKNGYARILHRKGIGFIDKSKTLIINKRIFEVRDFYNGLARFQTL